MFGFKKKFSPNLSIDLGTANLLISTVNKGIVVNEATVVAINNKTDQILAIGHEAEKMIGRTPQHISVIKPLINGIISDFEATEKMLKYFLDKMQEDKILSVYRPRVIVGTPIGVTEVERKAVEDAVFSAGAKEVFLVENSIATALGSQMFIEEASGNLVVDLGAGSTEIAVISLEGIVNWKKLEIAGNKLNQDIVESVREDFNVLLGERIAEKVKREIGSAIPLKKEEKITARGRDLLTGLPKEITLSSEQIRSYLKKSLEMIIEDIKSTLETTPPELVADIYQKGIIISGGGALLKGFDKMIAERIHTPVKIADDPITAVIRGLTGLHEDERKLKNIVSLIDNSPVIK